MGIYVPSEDSYFFVSFLRRYLFNVRGKVDVLDVGTGSGILARTMANSVGSRNVLACDIDPEAVEALQDESFKVVQSDLFENIKGKFDLVVFNAPYLPRDEREPSDSALATTGGREGDELALRFLDEVFDYLKPEGRVLLLVSSLTPRSRIDEFGPREVARKELFGETLFILEFSNEV